jgi:hypothetical protein
MAAEIIGEAQKVVLSHGVEPDDADSLLDEVIEREAPHIAPDVFESLLKDMPAQVRWWKRQETGFRRRNRRRWKMPLDLLEAEWAVAQEAGTEFFQGERLEAEAKNNHLFKALANLHSRGLLVAREAICLIECGFPDGAMSRWRTLHEYNAIAHFLLEHGNGVAELYLASATFTALKRAKNAQKHAKLDPSAKISANVIASLERRCAELRANLGHDLSGDYAWAAPTLGQKRANLLDIEEATGRDFWRPRFGWASQHIHGSYIDGRSLLGMVEAGNETAMVVGPSNGGMVDPMQMVAHSLADVSEALLSSKPDIIRRIAISVLWMFANDVGQAAMESQESFRRRHGYDPEK